MCRSIAVIAVIAARVLILMNCAVLTGCGRAPSTPPDASAKEAVTASTSLPTAGNDFASQGQVAAAAPSAAAEVSSQSDLLGDGSGALDSQPTASVAQPESQPDETASQPSATKPATTPQPTPEQVKKWSSPQPAPLQLLACYDGFSDGILQTLAVSPDGKRFVVGGARLTLWDFGQAQPQTDLLEKLPHSDAIERPIRATAISPDGKWLAAGAQDGSMWIWDLNNLDTVTAIKAHQARLLHLAFSPDSQLLATTSYAGEVFLWSIPEPRKISSWKVSDREVGAMQFLSDELLAVSARDATIWNVHSRERVAVVAPGTTITPTLGVSSDRSLLAAATQDSQIVLWDVQRQAPLNLPTLSGQGACFSQDGKWLATYSLDAITIWSTGTGQAVQVIDTTGGRTVKMQWLPQRDLLLVATELGRLRLWGTSNAAQVVGLKPLHEPLAFPTGSEGQQPISSALLQQTIDIRSLPKLPGAVGHIHQFFMGSYVAPATLIEAQQFYRFILGRDGWSEIAPSPGATETPGYATLEFEKNSCRLNITSMLAPPEASAVNQAATNAGQQRVQVHLNPAGTFDVRRLEKFSAIPSNSNYAFFSTASYRTKAELTQVEVGLLKQLHAAGWTGTTRLNASSREEPLSRTMRLLQRGSELTVMISPPADAADELAVQTSVNVTHKSLPIPKDCGWIEFDSSTDLMMVANTKLTFNESVAFFDAQMQAEGWIARDAGRFIKDDKAYLPYIRGGQDVLIRLVKLPDDRTRIVVGDAERSSWQLAKRTTPTTQSDGSGIQAADYSLPNGAAELKFDIDEKQIRFSHETLPPALAIEIEKTLSAKGWTPEKSGVRSEEYTFVTFAKDGKEIQMRARAVAGGGSSVIISGDGLLWEKPLPTSPVRISYETWLRRNAFDSTLERLDQFATEMSGIPVTK